MTVAAGVPTIWMGVLPELVGKDTSNLRSVICGGSAVPRALSEAWRAQVGLPILQAWGMTETSPVASVCHIKSTIDDTLDDDGRAELRTTIGQPVLGVEARIERDNPDDVSGELQVRGPWITAGYYDDDALPRLVHRRRLAAHRRRRGRRRARVPPARRPHEGRHQVGR